MRLLKRSGHKIDKSLDILNFIKQQRLNNVSMYALLPREKRKFAEKIAECIISEYSSPSSTCSSSDNEYFNPPNPSKNKVYDYVDDVITSSDLVCQNLINIYD